MATVALSLLPGWLLGTALQLQQTGLWHRDAYLGLVLLALLLLAGAWWLRSGRIRGIFLAVCAASVLAFGSVGWRASVYQGQALEPGLEGRDLDVVGVVAAMPQRNDLGLRLRFDVESASLDGARVRLPARIYLGWYGGAWSLGEAPVQLQRAPEDLRAGERWQMRVRLKAPHGSLNPHGFDYELWLWEQDLQATGSVRVAAADPAPRRLDGQTWAHPVESVRQAVRDRILERIADRRLAGIVAALVVGDQAAIERADWDVFRATGVAHLMSISGLHITMFAWAAAWLIAWLWRRSPRMCLALPAPTAALIGGVLLATGYAVFSGWGVPSQRTVIMLTVVTFLRLGARQWPWPAVWLLACAVVLALDPWAFLQAGFWLSFVAVGVLFATSQPQPPGPGWRTRLAAFWREQWVVTLALAPLTLLLFQQVSVVGLGANFVAIPWVTLVLTPLSMAGVLWAPLWDLAALSAQVLATTLGWLAQWPMASVSVAAAPVALSVLAVLGGVLLAMPWPAAVRALGLPLLLPALLWQAPRPAAGEFELLAADIGQGNAVLVRTAQHSLLYDSGPRYGPDSDAGHRVLLPLLRAMDERLDLLVLSHRDTDHTGGAVAVLDMQPQARLLSSIEDSHELQQRRPAQRCSGTGDAAQRWQWDGVEFEMLHPMLQSYQPGAKPNALSCVLRVSNGRQTVLLVGDIEKPQEMELLQRQLDLRADVLLVPHHGSKTSSSGPWLDAVQPRWALVQAGYRNRFGHPAPEVMQRYRERGVTTLETARCGAIHWASNDAQPPECERERSRRYWHHRLP